jgi:hypothetical protein
MFINSSFEAGKIAANTQIYDIRRFICKDIYPDTLLISVIHTDQPERQERKLL